MAKLLVVNNLSLDGVMQAPGRAEEDTRGGFANGGWALPYNDAVMAREMGKGLSQEGALLFGRRTYEDFYRVWPHRADGNPYTDVLNRTQKYVASRTLTEPLPWENSALLNGDAASCVAELKSDLEGQITVLGSGDLLRTLIGQRLVDEYVLLIYPLLLGAGRRMFPDGVYIPLELTSSVTTTTGVAIASYRDLGSRKV